LSLKLVKSDTVVHNFQIELTERQKLLIVESFAQFEPIVQYSSKIFFDRLAEVEPSLGAQFCSETNVHSDKLATVLQIAVISVRNLDALVPMLRLLGSEYRSYGARPEYYEIFGDVLLWTLQQGLGDTYTEEVNEAWATLYGIIAEMMMQSKPVEKLQMSAGLGIIL
jgi:hemoglobin-like flavoprotein